MRWLGCWLLVFSLIPFVSLAEELAPAEFAFGLPLEVSGAVPFYELEVPLAVYRGSQRSDLGDLRVFNAAGKVVPHALRSPANQTRQQDLVSSELPIFPLPGQVEQAENLVIRFERTSEGAIVDLRSDGQVRLPDAGEVRNYLLDASGLEQPIDALELHWADETPAFLAEVVIEASNDLVTWKRLTTAAVARLAHRDFRLDQNRIPLPRTNRRYLRLGWPEGQSAPFLTRVMVIAHTSTVVERPPSRRLQLEAEPAGQGRYRVDLQGALPVAAVTIELSEKNSLASMRLLSAATAKGMMRQRWQGLAYHLATNGTRLTSPAINLAPSRQRYWELVLNDRDTTLTTPPRLGFSWQPDRLVFLAQGAGPYFVAYGNRRLAPTNFNIHTLLKLSVNLAQPQLVEPGEPVVLGGADRAAGQAPLPWKEYLLWGVLALGVLLIGVMSYSLYRKLRETEPRQ